MKLLIPLLTLFVAIQTSFGVQPELTEFAAGKKTRYSTQGHAKAKGSNISICYPNSWTAKEGDRPNIVQKFVGPEGTMVSITIKSLGMTPTAADLESLYDDEFFGNMVPEGGKLISSKATKLDGTLAGQVAYSLATERAGIRLETEAFNHVFIVGDNMISVAGSVGAQPGKIPTAKEKMDAYRPLFTAMAASVIIADKWK